MSETEEKKKKVVKKETKMEVSIIPATNLPPMAKTADGVIGQVATLMELGTRTLLVAMWKSGSLLSRASDDSGRFGSKFVERAAAKLGKSPRIIWDAIKFFKLNPDLDAVKDLKIEWSAARALNGVEDEVVREAFMQEIVAEKLTVREIEQKVKKYNAEKHPAKAKPSTGPKPAIYFKRLDAKLQAIQVELTSTLAKRFDMYPVAVNPERTNDEDFTAIEECTKRISATADSLVKLLQDNASVIESELDSELPEDAD